MQENYYTILGVATTAGEDEIRRAYRDLVAEAMDDQPRFQALSEAFETLKDPVRRSAYDQRLAPAAATGTAALTASVMQPGTLGSGTVAMPRSNPGTGVYAPPSSTIAANTAAAFVLPTVCPASLSPCPLKAGQIVPDQGFCPECGVLMTSLTNQSPILKEHPRPYLVDSNGREYALKVGENLVGREGADILLPDKSVSRRHAQFTVQENNVVILSELGSTNGSRHGATPLGSGQSVPLKDNDELRFGAVRLTIRIPAPPVKAIAAAQPETRSIAPKAMAALPSFSGETAPTPAATQDHRKEWFAASSFADEADSSAATPKTGAQLIGSGTNSQKHFIGTVAETTVGRKPENALMITTDPYISGKHAVILFENDRYKVMDLGSTNGTRWNGRKLLPQVPQSLSEGDEVIFGQTAFLFTI